jgi:hypothetical membrane protein
LSRLKSPALLKISGIYGILAPVFAFTLILLAIANYSSFSWTQNALSDLGVVPGVTSSFFNSGLIICGVWGLNFTIGLFILMSESILGRVGATVFASACLALVAIGMFPENIAPTHYYASVAFFVLLPISMLILVGALWGARQTALSTFTLLLATVAATPWILLFSIRYVSGVAIPELISALAGAAWIIVLGSKMIKEASHLKSL